MHRGAHGCTGGGPVAGEERQRPYGTPALRRRSGQIEDHAYRFADLEEHGGADVASDGNDAMYGDRPDVLALGSRGACEAVVRIGAYDHLRVELTDRRGQGHHLHDGGKSVKDALGRHDDGRVAKACLASLRHAEVEIDDVTRVGHRAN